MRIGRGTYPEAACGDSMPEVKYAVRKPPNEPMKVSCVLQATGGTTPQSNYAWNAIDCRPNFIETVVRSCVTRTGVRSTSSQKSMSQNGASG